MRSGINIIGHEIHHHNIASLSPRLIKGFYPNMNRAAFDKISATFIDHHIDNCIKSRSSLVLVMLLTLPKVSLQELYEGAYLDRSGLKIFNRGIVIFSSVRYKALRNAIPIISWIGEKQLYVKYIGTHTLN
ncbi:hypothetical protein BG74_04660 [Sodalis-like endosymbiont of Proechinophthirus fluctus]|nr:hypothetical protein BG74_04660 [Sodalis-like endosymbiont of Proechinophthirus fluctus]